MTKEEFFKLTEKEKNKTRYYYRGNWYLRDDPNAKYWGDYATDNLLKLI